MYETVNFIFMLKSLLPKEVKVDITIDGVRLKSNFTTNKIFKYTKKLFFCVILGFTQSQSGELGDMPGLVQIIPGSR